MRKFLYFIIFLLLTVNCYATGSNFGYISGAPLGSGSGSFPTITDTGTNVGIGSSSPGQKLDVNGTVRATAFQTNGSGSSYLQLFGNAADTSQPPTGYGNLYEKSDKTLYFQDDAGTITSLFPGSSAWTVSGTTIYATPTTQNVGIGTLQALDKLIITGGNVGIGTLNPTALLELNTSTQTAFRILGTNASFLMKGSGVVGNQLQNSGAGGKNWEIVTVRNAPAGSLEFNNTSDTITPLTLASGGNIGITSANPGQRIDVAGGGIRILGTNRMFWGNDNLAGIQASGNTTPDLRVLTGNAEMARFTNGGNLGIASTAPGTTLDVFGTFRVIGGSGTIGSVKTGANTACTTTCGSSKCLLGEDTAVVGTIVACTDATADVCVCLGP